MDEVGNATLVLNANSPIGKRGDVFFVFKDDGIYREVLKYGKCEAELSEFIADVINDADYKITFIDLGANSGIISRQVLERTDKFINIFAVEPLEELCLSINKNLAKFNRNLKLTVFQNALVSNDVSDDEVEFFVDSRSVGNSSLLAKIAPPPYSTRRKVKTLTVETLIGLLNMSEKLVVKSDLQGLDADILASATSDFWDKVEALVVEVLPAEFINERTVGKIIPFIDAFSVKLWATSSSSEKTTTQEIRDFWLSKQGSSVQRNLLLKR